MIAECTKLGVTVEKFDDYWIINLPAKHNGNVLIQTYDHRMAMPLAVGLSI